MNYKKITKSQARKLFDQGKEIFLHTNKLSWNNPWQNPMALTKDFEREKSEQELIEWKVKNGYEPANYVGISQFEERINNFSYYNCDDERGNIVIYLIEDK
jgi:hypothetical protein